MGEFSYAEKPVLVNLSVALIKNRVSASEQHRNLLHIYICKVYLLYIHVYGMFMTTNRAQVSMLKAPTKLGLEEPQAAILVHNHVD